MISWNSIILAPLLWLGIIGISSIEKSKVVREIPIMNVNIYLMGKNEIDEESSSLIEENINYLNQEFEGVIKFNLQNQSTSTKHAYLTDIYIDFHDDNQNIIDSIVTPIERKGAINVFVFDTREEEENSVALMGFSPRFVNDYEAYETNSPYFDRIYMAYEGLLTKTTLVHEMGHFFGLSHPWELTDEMKIAEGLESEKEEQSNHMSYGPDVHKFTPSQLSFMHSYVLNYRRYLTQGILKIYNRV